MGASNGDEQDRSDRTVPRGGRAHFRSRPRLTWKDASGPRSIVLDAAVILGSSPSAALVIADPAVSRVHAEIEPRDEGLRVRDLSSRNGSWIGETRVFEAIVPHGTRLRFGSTEIDVAYGDEEPKLVEAWPVGAFGPLLGESDAMRELFALLERVAASDAPVLVRGETGCGKELVASAIHGASARASGPFVVVDCAALPESLLDAELFGHARGAFTGAQAARPGAFESAHGGTVFLDEIGELSLAMQPKLLRVLESRTVRRLGEAAHRPVDVRFVCATHRDLAKMVAEGSFREDLYFRVSVLPITPPPLRERATDIPMLVAHFLRGKKLSLPPEAEAALVRYPWPGNVRELRNFVDRALTLGVEEAVRILGVGVETTLRSTLPPALPSELAQAPGLAPIDDAAYRAPYRAFREAWGDAGEREYFGRLVARHAGDVHAAATEAAVDKSYVYRMIRRHKL